MLVSSISMNSNYFCRQPENQWKKVKIDSSCILLAITCDVISDDATHHLSTLIGYKWWHHNMASVIIRNVKLSCDILLKFCRFSGFLNTFFYRISCYSLKCWRQVWVLCKIFHRKLLLITVNRLSYINGKRTNIHWFLCSRGSTRR